MEFEWDEAKDAVCLAARGFGFLYATRAFFDPDRFVEADERFDYGEPRFRLIGRIDGETFVVVYTPRHGRIRLISARRASRREVRRYDTGTGDDGA
jgi:uncharacterized DUF497 family protein